MEQFQPPGPERPYDGKWARLFLPQARPINPDDQLVAKSAEWTPSAWLVLVVILIDLATFAYVFSTL